MNLSQAYSPDGRPRDDLTHISLADALNAMTRWRSLPKDPRLLAEEKPVPPENRAGGVPARIIKAIKLRGPLTLAAIREAVPGVTIQRIKQELGRLEGRGIIKREGEHGKRRYSVMEKK